MRLIGNLKTDFAADFTNWKSMSGRISISEIRDKICFQILCSIGNPKIQILRSKSEFPNRKHYQLVEHRAAVREVVSSTPAGPTLRVLK